MDADPEAAREALDRLSWGNSYPPLVDEPDPVPTDAELNDLIRVGVPSRRRGMRQRDVTIEELRRRMGAAWKADLAEKDATIAALRAVLAPLLDEPWLVVHETSFAASWVCRCCGSRAGSYVPERPGTDMHEPDCPVRRRDALLGR